jgi:probable rRNA maturation factor
MGNCNKTGVLKFKKKKKAVRLYFENRQEKEPVSYALKLLLRLAVESTLEYEGVDASCEVSLTFVDNEQIHEMNLQFRGVDRPTDVLSFPLFEPDEELGEDAEAFENMLGDIVLSLEKARAQAEEFGHSFEREAAFLCVHSMLHLLGYDHETGEEDELDMRRRQAEILESMGLGVATEK